ncbi:MULTISPECIES: haloacid dehalogenase type II [Staphylococcus]|uniref:haloacid dehalogenase type II n=1 Tax=Staphylococcus TaxID=1279 RepID=UPI00315DFD6B
MYKAIIFDVYGTVFDLDSLKNEMIEFDESLANQISRDWRETQINHMFIRQIMHRYIPFDELTKNALRYTLNVHNIQYNREDINRLFDAFLKLSYYKEIPRALSDIKALGVDIGVLSNGNDSMLMPLIDNSEIAEFFDTVISVNEVKQYKPSEASYALILDY